MTFSRHKRDTREIDFLACFELPVEQNPNKEQRLVIAADAGLHTYATERELTDNYACLVRSLH